MVEGQSSPSTSLGAPATQGFAINQIEAAQRGGSRSRRIGHTRRRQRRSRAGGAGGRHDVLRIANIRGWAVAPQGLQRIELYLDGALQGNIPLGGRADVGDAYPAIPVRPTPVSPWPSTLHPVRRTAYAHRARRRCRRSDARRQRRLHRDLFRQCLHRRPGGGQPWTRPASTGNVIAIQNLMVEGQSYTVHLAMPRYPGLRHQPDRSVTMEP